MLVLPATRLLPTALEALPHKSALIPQYIVRKFTDSPCQRHVISIDQADSLIAAAVKEANSVIPENIAIVDPSGLLVAFHRMDNAFPGSIDISIKKARTVVLFNGAYSTADLTAAAQGPLYGLYALSEILIA